MTIEDRVIRLERENRRLKVGGLLGLLLVASVFVMGQVRPPQQVSARVFSLTDRDGVVIGEFKANDWGMPELALYYPKTSEPAIALRLYETVIEAPADRKGETSRTASLMVNRPNGKGGLILSAEDDRAAVQVFDAHNSVIAQMVSSGDYDGSISLQRVGPRTGAFPDGPVQTIFRVP